MHSHCPSDHTSHIQRCVPGCANALWLRAGGLQPPRVSVLSFSSLKLASHFTSASAGRSQPLPRDVTDAQRAPIIIFNTHTLDEHFEGRQGAVKEGVGI
ncbi:hypothetical protein NQZ68_028429 [Dissostichus eleginoides]|nr:hypothetical protein NQZ68_028429 [Dissostichus eleginoides]